MAKLVMDIKTKGRNEYSTESMYTKMDRYVIRNSQSGTPYSSTVASYIIRYWRSYPPRIIPTMPVTYLAVLTVQILFALKGKYKAIHFSTDIKTSNIDE